MSRVKARSIPGQSKVNESSRQGQGNVKTTQAQFQPQLQFDGF